MTTYRRTAGVSRLVTQARRASEGPSLARRACIVLTSWLTPAVRRHCHEASRPDPGLEPAGRPAVDGGDLAGLHQLLQPPQILLDLPGRVLAEQLGDQRPDLAGGRLVLQLDADLGPAAARGGGEVDRAGGRHLRAGQRAPADQAVG